jgi:hypothetical protein
LPKQHILSLFGIIALPFSLLVVITTCLGLYMVAVERQTQNRNRMLAENLKAMEGEGEGSGSGSGEHEHA